jgi:urea transport system permease protein
MVVVLGGVGQLAGTVIAALRPGHRQQAARAVVRRGARRRSPCSRFIIAFIQKRPQGLFALKGRAVEA